MAGTTTRARPDPLASMQVLPTVSRGDSVELMAPRASVGRIVAHVFVNTTTALSVVVTSSMRVIGPSQRGPGSAGSQGRAARVRGVTSEI
jgi:hypothetical protein